VLHCTIIIIINGSSSLPCLKPSGLSVTCQVSNIFSEGNGEFEMEFLRGVFEGYVFS